MMRKKHIRFLSLLLPAVVFLWTGAVITSCSKDPIREKETNPPEPPVTTSYENGIFVINEGNFNWGNASVTFIDPVNDRVEQNIFEEINNRSLGDVASGMKVFSGHGFIVVNNSNRVEVVAMKDFTSVASITGFNSPRCIEFIDSTKAYVTNLIKDISVNDLQTLSVKKSIITPNWTEGMIRYKNMVFFSSIGGYSLPNAQRNPQILIVDTDEDIIVDSIKTGKEPLGIVMDRKNKIWVLCTGGYDGFEAPTLLRIDPDLRIVEKTFVFQNVKDAPSQLCINSLGYTLYFLKGGVFQMPVTADAIPVEQIGRAHV